MDFERREYDHGSLRRTDLDPDPISQFETWFGDATRARIELPEAMTLATVSADGRPSARILLLRHVDRQGFVFYTRGESPKGRDLATHPAAALVFYWSVLDRQVRVRGVVEPTSRTEAEDYFRSRPSGSRAAAAASRQSEVVPDRATLEARFEQIVSLHPDGEVPAPADWVGYRVRPEEIEFWQGRTNRLHDRFCYTLEADGVWTIERLCP